MPSSTTLTLDELRLLQSSYPIIAIVGQSGTGKSTFINLISKHKQKVSDEDDINSCTSRIGIIEAKIYGKSVVVIDTPGIDDTREGVTEVDVLTNIAHALKLLGERGRWITGVLFLHRMIDVKFNPTALRITNMLHKLCGERAMNRITFCTTMWDLVDPAVGNRRHEKFCNGPWKGMIADGAHVEKHSSSGNEAQASAVAIISRMLVQTPVELAIQYEMINQKKDVADTGAAAALNAEFAEKEQGYKCRMDELRKELDETKKVGGDLGALKIEYGTLQGDIAEMRRQRARMHEQANEGDCCAIM